MFSKKKKNSIEEQIKRDRKPELKILLLGTGESGKSTIQQQLQFFNSSPTPNEREYFMEILQNNVIMYIQSLTAFMNSTEPRIPFDSEENRQRAQGVLQQEYGEFPTTPAFGAILSALWEDSGVKQAYERRSEFTFYHGAEYALGNIERFFAEDFVPTDLDILHKRVRQGGISEIKVKWQSIEQILRIFMVAGFRSERRKWVHCFEKVSLVVYCVSLDDYDLKLREDFEVVMKFRWFVL